MVQSNAANLPPDSNSQMNSSPPPTTDSVASPTNRPAPERSPRWLPPLLLLLLLSGLGLGWRWWQGRADAPGGAPAGMQQGQGMPVKLQTLETETVLNSSEFIGSLEAENSLEVRPEITGRVSRIFVAKGQRVTAGTPLVQLSPDEQAADLASVLASVNAARATRANARSQLEATRAERVARAADVELQRENFQRISQLAASGALSQQDLDQARRDRDTAIAQLNAIDRQIQAAAAGLDEAEAGVAQAQANADRSNVQLQNTTIVAPFDGIVGDIPAKLGDVVTNSDILTTLTRNQTLNLRLSIPLERAPELSEGQRVDLTDEQGNVLQTGRISFISPRVESNAQSILAEATFDNAGGQLRDGQFVRARVIWEERPGILIPTAAVTRLAGEPFVFVAKPPEQSANNSQPQTSSQAGQAPALVAEQRPVELGNTQGNNYQVIKGLEPGEQIVVSGVLNLGDGVPIMPLPPSSEAPTGTSPQTTP